MSILHPPVEGAAFDAFLQNSAPASQDHQKWQPEDGIMPGPLSQPWCSAGLQ